MQVDDQGAVLVGGLAAHDAAFHHADDPSHRWTSFDTVFDKTIQDDCSGDLIRLELDQVGQGRVTFDDGAGNVVFLPWNVDILTDFGHLIAKGVGKLMGMERNNRD